MNSALLLESALPSAGCRSCSLLLFVVRARGLQRRRPGPLSRLVVRASSAGRIFAAKANGFSGHRTCTVTKDFRYMRKFFVTVLAQLLGRGRQAGQAGRLAGLHTRLT